MYMGQYAQALSYMERVFHIRERSLPPNYPRILNILKGIDFMKKNCKLRFDE